MRRATIQHVNQLECLTHCTAEVDSQSCVCTLPIPRHAWHGYLVFSPMIDAQDALVAVGDRIQVPHDESDVVDQQIPR